MKQFTPPLQNIENENVVVNSRRIEGLDFLKGFAILLVVIEHSIPKVILDGFVDFFPLKAVPIFFSITFFLMFKKFAKTDNYFKFHYNRGRFWNMFKKIYIPFFSVLFIQIVILFLIGGTEAVVPIFYVGGYGPGKYYPWVYFQIWLLAPILFWIVDRKKWRGIIGLLVICVLLNYLICKMGCITDGIYRLLSIRYFFLAAIAYIWLHHENYNKFFLLFLGFVSLIYLWYFRDDNLTPFIFNGQWSTHNYPGYFFTLVMIVFLLSFAKECKDLKIMKFFRWCGENSWYIFLLQMFIIGFIRGYYDIDKILNNEFWAIILYVLSVLGLTLGATYLWLTIKDTINKNKNIVTNKVGRV